MVSCWRTGDELHASVIASNLDPKLTFLKMLDAKELDPNSAPPSNISEWRAPLSK